MIQWMRDRNRQLEAVLLLTTGSSAAADRNRQLEAVLLLTTGSSAAAEVRISVL